MQKTKEKGIVYESLRDNNANIYYCANHSNYSTLHFHRNIEFTYALEDRVKCTLNGKTIYLDEGDVLFIDSYDIHSINVGEEKKKIATFILPPPQSYQTLRHQIVESKRFKSNVIKSSETAQMFISTLDSLGNSTFENELVKLGQINLLLDKILSVLEPCERASKKGEEQFVKILQYIDEHFTEKIMLEDISKAFGYSTFYFSKLFNNYFGCNLTDYINMRRVRNVAYLITQEKIQLNDAIKQSGFISLPPFYRAFNKTFRMTPKEFIRERNIFHTHAT